MASRTLQSTVEISGVLSPSLQAAIKNAVSKLEEMSEETLDAAGAAEKLCAEISTQESVLKSLQKGYADYVVSGKESSNEAQTLADKIQQLSGELDENKGTLQAAEKAAQRLADTQDDSADAYTRLERKIQGQQDELEALRREYANVVLEQGKTSKEAKALESKISSLSGELSENEKKLRDVGEAAEDAGRKAENSSEGYTVLKNVIANLATEAISSAVEGFKELALEGDTALGMLEAKTGAAGEKMAGFEDVMYEVYNANYGESLGDVSDKLSTVIQMTDDLDNKSLAKVTKNAIALDDVFGFDVKESMRAANSLMDQFGITSDQAFNLIVQGAQNGLNQNDDLLDTINEYSAQFKTAGYSADDMFNMLANGAESGTWSVDKLGDAVKEFNIRASDGTITDAITENAKAFGMTEKQAKALGKEVEGGSVEAYQKLLDKLKEVDDDAQRYQLGVAMFGTMWEDLGEETVLSLMDTQGELSKTANAMEKLDSAAYDTLESSLSQLGRTVKAEVVQPIAEKLTPVLKEAVEYVTAKVGPAVDWILAHLPEIGIMLGTIGSIIAAMKWGSIVAKITQVIGAIKGFIAALGAISAPVWAVIAVVAALAAAFVKLWRNNEDFRNKITAIWEGIKGKFEAFGQAITDRLNALGFDFENITEVLKAVWDGFCELLAPIFEGTFQQISNILGGVLDVLVGLFDVFAGIFTGDWDMVWEGVKEIFTGIWDFIVNAFGTATDTLKAVADVVLGWFGTSWEEVWGSVRDFFVDTWDSIVSFFSDTWNSIKTVASTAWNGIASFFTNAWNGIKTTFTNVWNGITSFLSSAWETIKNVVQVGVQFIGSILSAAFQIITLPFRFIWENCKEYVFAAWEWIKAKVTTAINAVKSVISTAWNAIKSVTSTVWNAIKSVISTVWGAISAKVAAVINTVKSVVSTAWNAIKSVTSTVWNAIMGVISAVWSRIKAAVSAAINAVKSVVSSVWNGIKSVTSSAWNGIKSTVSSVWSGIKSGVSSAVNSVKSTVSSVWNGIKSVTSSVWNGIKNAIITPIENAKNKIKGIVDAIKGFFSNMKISLPHIKLPHFKVTGKLSLNPPSVPKLSIEWYKEGGIMTRPTIFGASGSTLMAGGEAGAEAVLPLAVLWDKMEAILQRILSSQSSTGGTSDEGLTSKAGELLTLDNFSLGSLSDGTSVVIYYDFSGFTWSPQIQTAGTGDNGGDDLMARLRAHEAEFFDWLEEFIQMREVAQYA